MQGVWILCHEYLEKQQKRLDNKEEYTHTKL